MLTGLGDPERVSVWEVSSSFFTTLGGRPLLGRTFQADDHRPTSERVVVLSHGFWQTRFGGDRNVVGRTVTLDNRPATVVGVMPPEFRFPIVPAGARRETIAMWRPLEAELTPAARDHRGPYGGLWIVARLQPRLTVDHAVARLDLGLARVAAEEAEWKDVVATVVPLRDTITADVRAPLLLLAGAVGLVLLVACANVANLFLVRAVTRQREIAIRMAMGASRLRLVRQFATEAVLLALPGGALGVLLAWWSVRPLAYLAGDALPRVEEIGLDARVLIVTLGATILTGFAFGLAPALHAVRGASPGMLAEGSERSGMGPWRSRAGDILVVAQVALTLMLLAGTGVLARSFVRLVSVDTGFEVDHVVTAHVVVPSERYATQTQQLAFANSARDALRSLPGVVAATVGTGIPLNSGRFGNAAALDGPKRGAARRAWITAAMPDYFRVFGIPLERGTLFGEGPAPGANDVVISRAAARALFADEDPLGRRIAFMGDTTTVIGVVGDTRQGTLSEAAPPHIYQPLATGIFSYLKLSVRSSGDPSSLVPALRRAIREVDPVLPIDRLSTMRATMLESLGRQRFYLTMLAIFAIVATLMAVTGIYAVVAYLVARRTRELGVRAALGARRYDILALVVGRAMVLALVGLAVGLAGAAAATRLLAGFLFEVGATDPLVFATATVTLMFAALVASYIPARRAARVEPMVALHID